MEKVRKDALAYYNSMEEEQKKAVSQFFKSLDADGNGTVNLAELAEFLADEGVSICDSPIDTFRMFDRDGNGALDFEEVITLFYYLRVGPGAQKWAVRRSKSNSNSNSYSYSNSNSYGNSNSRSLENPKWDAREAMQFVNTSYNFGHTRLHV